MEHSRSCWSFLTFSWLGRLLRNDVKKQTTLEINELDEIVAQPFSAQTIAALLEKERSIGKESNSRPKLWRRLFNIVGYEKFVIFILLRSCAAALEIFSVILLWYYLKNINHSTTLHVVVLLLLWTAEICLLALVKNHFVYQTNICAIRLKVYLNECVYRKVSLVNRGSY